MEAQTAQEARLKIWVKPGEPLRESDWVTNGYESLADYVKSLDEESKRGYKLNGKPANTGDKLPLVTFGLYDPSSGVKEIVCTCADYKDLPAADLSWQDVKEKSLRVHKIVTFTNAKN